MGSRVRLRVMARPFSPLVIGSRSVTEFTNWLLEMALLPFSPLVIGSRSVTNHGTGLAPVPYLFFQSPSHRVKECNVVGIEEHLRERIAFSPLVIGSRSVTDLKARVDLGS